MMLSECLQDYVVKGEGRRCHMSAVFSLCACIYGRHGTERSSKWCNSADRMYTDGRCKLSLCKGRSWTHFNLSRSIMVILHAHGLKALLTHTYLLIIPYTASGKCYNIKGLTFQTLQKANLLISGLVWFNQISLTVTWKQKQTMSLPSLHREWNAYS